MGDIITLRGAALSKYKSIGEFAKALNWSRNKASRILSGAQSPTVDEVQHIAKCLNIDTPEMFVQIFFSSMSTKWTG